MKKYKPSVGLRDTLRCLLRAVTGLESLNVTSSNAWQAVFDLKNALERHADYQDNTVLAGLDAVFESSGWAGQGLRWDVAERGLPSELWFVRFKNKKHTKWVII